MTVSTLRREPDTDLAPQDAGAAPPPAAEGLRKRLADAQARLELQDEPALVKALSDKELAADRQVAEEVRAAERQQVRRSGLAAARRARKTQRAADREADWDSSDRLWNRRALSARRRAMSPDARLARLARAQRLSMYVLGGEVVAGVLVSAINVQHNMAAGADWHETAWWTWFLVDPLLSIPLIAILMARLVGGQWGRRLRGWRVGVVEIGLLVGMTLLNVGPYISHPLDAGVSGIVGHLIPPVMIAVGVMLAAALASYFAEILADAVIEADDGRMGADTAKVIETVVRVRALMSDGTLAPDAMSTNTPWLPSISQIGKRLAVGKPTAIAVHEAMERLHPNGHGLLA